MNILLEPGDNVVVVDPIYQSLFEIALSIGVEVRRWPLSDEEFATDLKSLTPLMDEHTKMVVVNYPHSPTGVMITKAEQQQLIKIIEQHGCYLVSDEFMPASVFGYDNHIRIGFGQREQEFKAGLELLGKFIKSL